MAGRRGKPQGRRRRTIDTKRHRLEERVRVWAAVKLRAALDLPSVSNDGEREYVTAIADAEANAYLGKVCRLEGAEDVELYCCSPVSSNDSEDEY